MKMRRLSSFLFCSLLLILLTVGSGFAAFYFADKQISDEQTVLVGVDERAELGNVKVLGEQECGYQIFLDTSSVYLFKNDNPTKNASFLLQCDFNSESLNIPDGYKVALVCDVTVSDNDERGIIHGKSGSYYYSNSIVDYFMPINAVFAEPTKPATEFTLLDNDSAFNSKTLTYRSVLFSDIYNSTDKKFTTCSFELKFNYKNYSLTDGTNNYYGTMSPQGQYASLEDYAQIMTAARNAKNNSKIYVVFKLILEKEEA